MRVVFTVKYHTHWGEKVFISISSGDHDASPLRRAAQSNDASVIEMHYHNEDEWRLETTLHDSTKKITYYYIVEDKNGVRTKEDSGFCHHVSFDQPGDSYLLNDDWLSKPVDNTFYTSAFTKNLFARERLPDKKNKSGGVGLRSLDALQNLTFRVRAPETTPDQIVAMAGNQPCLGNWNPNHAPRLSADNFPLWEIRLNTQDIVFPLEYKFLVIDRATCQVCSWEEGENRMIRQPLLSESQTQVSSFAAQAYKNACVIIDNDRIRSPQLAWKMCGTVVPVFSLRSEQSFGIGDIGDLKKLIDWAKITNQHIIQILPINDTTRTHTWKDSYPYSAISIYALHPLYINTAMMGELDDKKKAASYQQIQQRLNKKETVDYPSVEKYKTAYCRDFFGQVADDLHNNDDFQKFITQNKDWLIPYSAFSFLRDKYHTADFTQWQDDAYYSPNKMKMLCQPGSAAYNEFQYLFFIQYTLHNQMEAVLRYARDNRVILKGDLPIGVNRESVEAWTEPAYFNSQAQAGAPPDFFSQKGQNWSFPTYHWDSLCRDGFVWWKKRLHHLQQYFDSFRIDHILGFFRIWEIPIDYTEGLCGHFNPALPLQKNEIQQYGLVFDEQWLMPRIHKKYLPELFGDRNLHDLPSYLIACDAEHLTLNENVASQRKINHLFETKKDKKSQAIKNGLMQIANEVLFMQDPSHPEGYHPRISAAQSFRYRELTNEERSAFDALYHHFFFERHNDFWKQTALSRLEPLLKSTEMLICGEDLGMIPATVHEVMASLQICTLELERLSKTADHEFTDLKKLPVHSVCTTSTHDMNPIRAWWAADKEKTQRYYNHVLRRQGIAPESCTAEIATQIVTSHLNASSMMTIIPLQDWFAMDDDLLHPDINAERINDPTNPNHYWRYRMHITLESLIQATSFNEKIVTS